MPRFLDEHPDYLRYDAPDLVVAEVPDGMAGALHGVIVRHVREPGKPDLKRVVNELYSRASAGPTSNWGYDFLVNDLEDALDKVAAVKFPRFMDAMTTLGTWFGEEFARDLNEVTEDFSFGYEMVVENIWTSSRPETRWVLRESVEKLAATIPEVQETVTDLCRQTAAHLQQIRENLATDTDRARKDAVRDAMSAMETILKRVSGKDDIKEAVKALRAAGNWGPEAIVKDGLTIWDRLHDLHPDLRHGNPTLTGLDLEEGLYWIDRILAYIQYIARRHRTLTP